MSVLARDVAFSYAERTILEGVTLEVQPGEAVAVVGPNGAGKTTLIRLLTRVLSPSNGTIEVDGAPINGLGALELARRLAVVPQGRELPEDFTAHDIVMMGRTPHLGLFAREGPSDHAVVERAMRRTDTWRFADRRIGALSGGERQRVVLARALAQEPRYLLLDEPTNHLDLHFQVEVLRQVRQEVDCGLGALLVLHDLNVAARVCHRMVVLQNGRKVADGPPEQVLSESLLAEVYGASATVFSEPGTRGPVVVPRF